MTVFVSYIPGTKGKFVTEICDLSKNEGLHLKTNVHGGSVYWLNPLMEECLNKNKISQTNYHGIHPEDKYYKFYIDTIVNLTERLKSNFSVDIHYTSEITLNYILSKGHKLIRIISTDTNNSSKLHNNFFYKNFINQYKNDPIDKANFASFIMTKHNDQSSLKIKKDFNSELIGKMLHEWDKDSLRILFNICGLFTNKIQQPNIIEHENLFEVNVNDLDSIDTLESIINFVGGSMNDAVVNRITQYNNAQKDITTFDEYIDDFLNNN
jgi:hypothetical protein